MSGLVADATAAWFLSSWRFVRGSSRGLPAPRCPVPPLLSPCRRWGTYRTASYISMFRTGTSSTSILINKDILKCILLSLTVLCGGRYLDWGCFEMMLGKCHSHGVSLWVRSVWPSRCGVFSYLAGARSHRPIGRIRTAVPWAYHRRGSSAPC